MTFLDTNIFLRFLTRDDAPKADACRTLFQRLDRAEEQATTSESVIAEVVYVLSARARTGYGLTPAEVAGQRALSPSSARPEGSFTKQAGEPGCRGEVSRPSPPGGYDWRSDTRRAPLHHRKHERSRVVRQPSAWRLTKSLVNLSMAQKTYGFLRIPE